MKNDVTHGYCPSTPLDWVWKVKGALMTPMNIMCQITIDEHRMIMEKDCLTHNQSYRWGSGASVTARVRKSPLLPYMFGA